MQTTVSASENKSRRPTPVAKQFVQSDRMYCSGYRVHSFAYQVERLMAIFPDLIWFNPDDAPQAPPDAEGAFLIPRWPLVGMSYVNAVSVMLQKLSVARKARLVFPVNLLECLEEEDGKREHFAQLRAQQKGKHYLVVHAQFGLHHRGQSVRYAKSKMDDKEFGLGLFEVIAMLLTHPERLAHNDDLGILCAGDEYQGTKGVNRRTPHVYFCGDTLYIGTSEVQTFRKDYGVASMMFR